MGKIYKKDALQFLESLDADSVDLVVSSPPYFMGKEYDTSSNVDDFVAIHQRLFPAGADFYHQRFRRGQTVAAASNHRCNRCLDGGDRVCCRACRRRTN